MVRARRSSRSCERSSHDRASAALDGAVVATRSDRFARASLALELGRRAPNSSCGGAGCPGLLGAAAMPLAGSQRRPRNTATLLLKKDVNRMRTIDFSPLYPSLVRFAPLPRL